MIRKLKSGEYRLYSRKTDPMTGRRRNLGTFKTRAAAEKHERAIPVLQARRMTVKAAPVIHKFVLRLVFSTIGRYVDEHIRNDWQRMPDPVIEVIHRSGELLDIQVRRWTNFGYDDHLFGAGVSRTKRQDLFDRRVILDDRV